MTNDIHTQITHLNEFPPQCGRRIHLWQYTPTTQTSNVIDVDPVHMNSSSEDTFLRTDQVGNLFCKTNSNLTAKPLTSTGEFQALPAFTSRGSRAIGIIRTMNPYMLYSFQEHSTLKLSTVNCFIWFCVVFHCVLDDV